MVEHRARVRHRRAQQLLEERRGRLVVVRNGIAVSRDGMPTTRQPRLGIRPRAHQRSDADLTKGADRPALVSEQRTDIDADIHQSRDVTLDIEVPGDVCAGETELSWR